MLTVNRNKIIVVAVDALLLAVSYFLAFVFRFENLTPGLYESFAMTVWIVVPVKVVMFSLAGLHKGPWRFTGILDLVNVVRATAAGSVVAVAIIAFMHGADFSRTVFVLDGVNTVILVGLFRLGIRIVYSSQLRQGVLRKFLGDGWWEDEDADGKRTLIYGADERGEILLRSLLSAQESTPYRVVGIVDDEPGRRGTAIHGIRHVGTSRDLDALIEDLAVSEVIIANDPGKETVQRVFNACKERKVPCRVVPPYLDLVHQRIGAGQLRKIDIDDLLRRDTVKIDYSRVEEMLRGKRVMVTGAAGSIGRQLCLQILESQPAELVCIDIGENPLHYLQMDVQQGGFITPVFYYCSSVTDRRKTAALFEKHKPHLVFHAAAHKHVPMMEMNIDSAILNNVGGTRNVADLADEYGVQTFVFISTDKAVRSTNVMGWTKRMGEVYVQCRAAKSRTKYLSVRFGNVLGSNGSVVPMFKAQIEAGGPLTVTHPETTRYFMTIPEAVLLILQSVLLGGSGNTMILDMGQPVKIADLAEEMIRLAGYAPGKEIEIKFTGLRPGEKLHEELMYGDEERQATSHQKITLIRPRVCDANDMGRFIDGLLRQAETDPLAAYEEMKKRLSSTAGVKAGV